MSSAQREKLEKLQESLDRLIVEMQRTLANTDTLSPAARLSLSAELGGLAAAKAALNSVG